MFQDAEGRDRKWLKLQLISFCIDSTIMLANKCFLLVPLVFFHDHFLEHSAVFLRATRLRCLELPKHPLESSRKKNPILSMFCSFYYQNARFKVLQKD